MPAIFITGSSRGIGKVIADAFLSQGWEVGVHGKSAESIERAYPGTIENLHKYSFDVVLESELSNSLLDFYRKNDGIDAVVHCAGIMEDAPLGMISKELINSVIGTNTVSSLNLLQISSRLMARKLRGSIILLQSVVGLDGTSGQVLYSTSKSSISGMVKSAAKELGNKGIRVNSIAPGLIQTDLINGLEEETLIELIAQIPLGRLGVPEDIVGVVKLLVSDEGRYITGTEIRIDGGLRL